MTAKITIELDDKASKPLKDMGQAASVSKDGFDDLGNEVQNLESQINELVDALHDQADANQKVNDSQVQVQKSGSSVAEKITAISTGTLAAIEIFKKIGETAKKAFELIQMGAEAGNPAAIEMVEAVDELKGALADMANDPLVQDFLKGMADTIRNDVVPAMKAIPDAWRATQNAISGGLTSLTDWVGLTEGATEEMRQMADQQARMVEQQKTMAAEAAKQMEIQKSVAGVEKELAKIEEAKRQNAEKESLAAVKSLQQLETRLKTETDALKAMAKEGKLVDEEKSRRLNDIVMIEGRIVELKKEQQAEQKKQVEDTKKWWEGLQKAQDTLAAAAKSTYQKMTEEAKKNLDAVIAKEKSAIDTLVAKLKELKGEDGQAQDVVSKIKGSLTDQQVLQQIGANRQKAAEDAARAAGKSDRQIAAAGKKARQTAGRQAMAGGQFDPNEVAAAQDALTNSIVDQAAAAGNLSTTQSKALRAAATAQMEAAKVQQEQQAMIEEITSAIDEITQGTKKIGQRQRAQRGAAGR